MAGNGEVWKKEQPDEKWIVVQRKRLRNQFIGSKGKAESVPNSKFKAAEMKVPLFISNVHTEVLKEDIAEYIYEKTKESVFDKN